MLWSSHVRNTKMEITTNTIFLCQPTKNVRYVHHSETEETIQQIFCGDRTPQPSYLKPAKSVSVYPRRPGEEVTMSGAFVDTVNSQALIKTRASKDKTWRHGVSAHRTSRSSWFALTHFSFHWPQCDTEPGERFTKSQCLLLQENTAQNTEVGPDWCGSVECGRPEAEAHSSTEAAWAQHTCDGRNMRGLKPSTVRLLHREIHQLRFEN